MNILLGINAVLLIVLIISCSKESIQSFIAKHKQAKKLHSTDENRNKVFSTNEGENIFILSENNNKVSCEYFKNKDSIKPIHFYNPNTEIDTATFTGCESLTDIKNRDKEDFNYLNNPLNKFSEDNHFKGSDRNNLKD